MSGSVGTKILTSVALVVVALTTICAVRFNGPQYRAYKESMAYRARLQAENAARNMELSELRRDQERFQSDEEFVVKVARQNRKLFPGEILFTFPTPEE